ncbi:Signal transduction histidine-protein kinase ArlS [Microbacterium oxydans]|uniref:histidine kinase n=1 Tax=Microbacterium oxydans TaxID=82380 RepID=A0A0F0LA07_9MICO|nr:HAMP domain-containing sensor histidine kinase [Microbacterium oxydans]KJL29110.1 Signal transduction histidine-protein kinase ArlS [Microbacterium oxydans]CAH0231359.1 Signal transduction histidine-protein kinase ArlS [Microbacterium oxydans]
MNRGPDLLDADTRLVRAAGRRVGVWIAGAVSALVVGVLIAALLIVFSQIPPDRLFAPGGDETTIDIEGADIVVAAIGVGIGAILLAGTIALVATRRAVVPLMDALRRQRHFVADASHELRTPLAILDARLQVLQRVSGPNDPNAQLITELRDDSRDLQKIVTDLLDSMEAIPASRTDAVFVDRAVEAAAAAMRAIAHERGVDIVTTPAPPEVSVAIPEVSLQRSLVALLDNAIKHSPPGAVELSTAWDRAAVTITVIDHGPGIRGIDASRIFDRFARSSDAVDGGGTARSGFGIGLALVNDTISRYGGRVAVVSTSPSGTAIEIVLPRHVPGREERP